MNVLRHIVSGDKFRTKDGEIDLDLTYITPRIIAMGIPGNDINILWRNHINDVANFLHKHHENNYLIVNLSGEKYDYNKFRGTILEFGFPDHNSPPLALLNEIVVTMDSFLNAKPEHVIAVHCLAGRSRTGTIVSSYLLYCGRFSVPSLARQFFNNNRSLQGSNVVLPSQIRYVDYFAELMRGRVDAIQSPRRLRLKRIMLTPLPLIKKCIHMGSITPIVEILENVGHTLLGRSTYTRKCRWTEVPLGIQVDCDVIVSGDIQLKFYQSKLRKGQTILVEDSLFHSGNPNKMSLSLLFRVTLHTSFVPRDYRIAFTKCECDAPQAGPLDNPKFPEDFRVTLVFEEPTATWTPTPEFRISSEDFPRPIDARLPPMTDSMRADAAAILSNSPLPKKDGSALVKNLIAAPKFKAPPAETPGSLELSALSLDTDQRLPKWGNRSNDLTDKRDSAVNVNKHREAPEMRRATHAIAPAPASSPYPPPSSSAGKNPFFHRLMQEQRSESAPHLPGIYSSVPITDLEGSMAPMLPKRAASDASSVSPHQSITDLKSAIRHPSGSRLTRDSSSASVTVQPLAPPPSAAGSRLSRDRDAPASRSSTTPSSAPTPPLTPGSSAPFIQFTPPLSAAPTTFLQLHSVPSQPAVTAVPSVIPASGIITAPTSGGRPQSPAVAPSFDPQSFLAAERTGVSPRALAGPPAAPQAPGSLYTSPTARYTSPTIGSKYASPPLAAAPTFNPVLPAPTPSFQTHTQPPSFIPPAIHSAPVTFPLGAALRPQQNSAAELFRTPFLAEPKPAPPSVPPSFVPYPPTPKTQ